MDWLQRYFGAKGIRIHQGLFDNNDHPWHIDVNWLPMRPGLGIYNTEWYQMKEEFKKLMKMNDWELIPAAKPLYVHKNLCYLTGLYESRSWISMNTITN
ncbi:hypothetical protein ES705_42201 [subsurface metagenome]